MGKKGVLLDNGKNAQSSMALYWRKHHQQSKQPKKQYQPTQQQQLDQRVQSGFQKWKLHKQKFISKAYQKKQKPITIKNQQKYNQIQQGQEIYKKQQKKKGPIHIPGFKSKQALQQKLRPQYNKQVSQSDNLLKLPSHLADFTQDDILRVLRQKKAQQDLLKKRKNIEQEDVILGDNFLQSFKEPKQKQQEKPIQKQQAIQNKVQQLFFKSNLLNEISKGNLQVILPPKVQTLLVQNQLKAIQQSIKVNQTPEQQATHNINHIKPLFKPRVLGNKK